MYPKQITHIHRLMTAVAALCVVLSHAAWAYVGADLPPLLEFADGTLVRTTDEWQQRQTEIRGLMVDTFAGTFPTQTPRLLDTQIVSQTKRADGVTEQRVVLTFATAHRISMEICLWIPPGHGPWPVVLVAPVDWQVDLSCLWPQAAVTRGYVACMFPGVSFTCKPAQGFERYKQAIPAFRAKYPDATWADLSCGAWMASRAVDYLLDTRCECPILKDQIGIIGHSRYGKQALMAAAFDTRITAVVARSPGSPASCPYRFTSRDTFAETPADFPGDWFLPSLKRYDGREHELPMDAHGWYALIAPRRCLVHTAHNDGCEPTIAVERGFREGFKVYDFLGYPENLRVLFREGAHRPVTEAHRQDNFDWFDLSFGRGKASQSQFPVETIHHFDWPAWRALQTESDVKAPAVNSPVRERIIWALGQRPEALSEGPWTRLLTDEECAMMTHDRWSVANTKRIKVCFGNDVRGNIYYNPTRKGPAPAVIWLHPYSYHSGYNEGYGVQGTTVYHRLAQAGFVVLAYDQCGFGLRLLEGRNFYQNHPTWSRLGRLVDDVSRAVDFLVDGKGIAETNLPEIDRDRITVLGYSLGGMVGLYAGALDTRIAAVACFCGFTPMRTDTDGRATGGTRRLWEWHALQPKLGLFHGREAEIPYDFDEVIAMMAPRKCLIYAPTRDRFADSADIKACVTTARAAWSDADGLTFMSPDDICRFQKDQQDLMVEWIKGR